MSTEIAWGNWEPSKSKPNFSFGEMADQEYDRYNKAEKASAYVEGVIGAYDRRNDDVFKATGEKLFNPLRDIPSNDDLAEMQAAYREMVAGGVGDKSRTTFQQEWFASKYEKRLKELAERHPQHMPVIKADRSPILDYAEIAQAAERKSADMAERLDMVDVRQSMPSLKNVPVIPDIANLSANLATNPTATIAQFWGGFKAQISDPVEATLNLVGFGAGKASMSVLKTALRNAASNAAAEAIAQPVRQLNRKDLGLEYGWDRFFADVGGAAATGAMLDAGVRIPYRAAVTRFGRDTPEGTLFSKQGRGGILTDAIPQTEPIKPIVREQITPDEIERAKANDLDAIESIARKTGALEDPGVKGAINYAKTTGKIDDAMVERFKSVGVDHGEMMNFMHIAVSQSGVKYTRMPDPIPEARAPLDTAGAAELAPRLAEIEQRLAGAPQEVREAVRAGVQIGAPEIVKAARAALSGDLEGMRAAIAEAGGETVMMDRVTVHTSANPVAVARALRRSPQVMDSNVPMRSEFMRTARAVAALDDAAFDMVLRGQAHPKAGELVANMVPPGQHAEVLRSIEGFRDIAEAKEAIPDMIREGTAEPDNRVKVSDPSGADAKAQVDALEKAHAKEVEAATEPARKREELESKVETLKGEIAKLEGQQGKMFAMAERGKATVDETALSPADKKLLDKLTERTGLKPDELAEQRAQGQSFGKKIDAALDKATRFEGAEKAADELAQKRMELRQAEMELERVQMEQARSLGDPALFRMVMERAAIQRRLDVKRSIDDALRLGDRMLPEGTKVEIRTDEMRDPTTGSLLDAASDMTTGDIALASYALNPAGRMGHEGVHTLVTRGHISPQEITMLAKLARERDLFKTEAKYREAYAGRDNLDALIDEEAAAHAIEARINGTDLGPANTMADRIKQLVERIRNALSGYGFRTADDVARAIIDGEAAQRQANVEWMRGGEQAYALADVDTGRSMRRDFDALGYYSKALEAAKAIPQAKGTPEQMLAALKKAGVKDAEIEATNLPAFLDGKKSITRDEIVKHLTENRVGVNEKSGSSDAAKSFAQAIREQGAKASDIPDYIKKLRSDQNYSAYIGDDPTILRLQDEVRNSFAPKWSSYSLDPSNPTYRETVLHLPDNRIGFQERAAVAEKRLAELDALDGNLTSDQRAEYSRLRNGEVDRENFRSGHFSEPNIIGHMMTSMTKHEGRPVYTIDQIQSDWGQKLRDGGVRDEAKIAKLKAGLDGRSVKDLAKVIERWHYANEKVPVPKTYEESADLAGIGAEYRQAKLMEAELRTAEAATPGNPLVNTTDQWTTTTLRRALRQAVEADAEFIAIPHGDTVLSYNPGDTNGMRQFYGKPRATEERLAELRENLVEQEAEAQAATGIRQENATRRIETIKAQIADAEKPIEGIVPKNLRKILEKIDKDSAKPTLTDKLETPSGMKGSGFTIFPITDKVRRSVMDEGQAMFALSEYRRGRDVAEPENLWFWQQPQKSGTVLMYHATNRSFDKFDMGMSSDFGIHFGSARQAAQRLSDTGRIEGGRTIPAEVTVNNAITMGDLGFWGPVGMATALQRQGYKVTAEEWKRFTELADAIDKADADVQRIGNSVKPRLKSAVNDANDAIKAKLNEIGIDGIWYKNTAEGRGWSLAVWNEGQVKSAITGEQLYAMSDGAAPIDPLKSDMAVVDRMSQLRDLIEACRA